MRRGIAASVFLALTMNTVEAQAPKKIDMKLPDGRNVTFDCGDLLQTPNGTVLTGAFVASADFTPPEQIEMLKKRGLYTIWDESRRDRKTSKGGMSMLRHIATAHPPEYTYCTAQNRQLETGVWEKRSSDKACPPIDAYLQCGKP